MKFVLSGLSKEDVTLLLTLIKQYNELCCTKMLLYKSLGAGYEKTIERLLKLHRRCNALVGILNSCKQFSDKEYKQALKERSFE